MSEWCFHAGLFGVWNLYLLPSRTDNYIYVLLHDVTKEALLIDPGEKSPADKFFESYDAKLTTILLTHHHADHIMAAKALAKQHEAIIIGAEADSHRLPPLTIAVNDGTLLTFAGETVQVMEIPGHTIGHVAYYFTDATLLFCGDTLFSLGCGRLFEGTPEMMMRSLKRLSELPPETHICCGHEYTLANAEFAAQEMPESKDLPSIIFRAQSLRAKGLPTLPCMLADELRANPFLQQFEDVASFAELRQRKDHFVA